MRRNNYTQFNGLDKGTITNMRDSRSLQQDSKALTSLGTHKEQCDVTDK